MTPRGWPVAFLGLMLASPVAAAEGGAAVAGGTASPGVVELSFSGAEDRELESSLREILDRIRVPLARVDSSRPDAGTPVGSLLAKVSVELDAREVRVTVTKAATTAVVLSRTFARSAGASVLREEVALVVRSAIDAILYERSQASEPPPKPEPLPTARSASPALLALAHGSVRSFARDSTLQLGGGSGVTLRWGHGAWSPGITLSGTYYAPVVAVGEGAEVRLSSGSVRLLPSLTLFYRPAFALEAFVGGGIDVVATASKGTSPNTKASPDQTEVLPVASALFSGTIALGSRASFFLGLGADIDLLSRRYVIARGQGRDSVIDPMRVHVLGTVGFSVQLFGPTRDNPPMTKKREL